MKHIWRVAAISGSNREESMNHRLIKVITDLASDIFTVDLFQGMTDIPPFDPDLDGMDPPIPVFKLRSFLRQADGILICTPEYAAGVPGTLKNALDWTVSSMELSRKPIALITAATSGQKAHQYLLGTLLILEAMLTNDTQLVIPFVKTKVSAENRITDDQTLANVRNLIQAFNELMRAKAAGIIPESILLNEGLPLL